MIEERQSYCPSCQRLVLARRPNNSFLLLFLFCLPLALLLMLFAGWVAPPLRCPVCGSATTNEDGSSTSGGFFGMELRGALILLGVLLVFVLGGSYWVGRMMTRMPEESRQQSARARAGSSAPAAKTRAATLTPEAAERLRLVRENDHSQDAARMLVLRDAIVRAGYRCETVSAAYLGSAGYWEVYCPGSQYKVEFDGSGKVVRVFKMI